MCNSFTFVTKHLDFAIKSLVAGWFADEVIATQQCCYEKRMPVLKKSFV
jgi:hypothetical protein